MKISMLQNPKVIFKTHSLMTGIYYKEKPAKTLTGFSI